MYSFPFRLSLLLPLALLAACSWQPVVREQAAPVPVTPETVESHDFGLNTENSVVGRLATVPVQEGDTLLDIARHYGLGHSHIAEANPGIDVWLPQPDARAVLPLQFILPDAPRKGVVINLATMRLFRYTKSGELRTYPVGIGREGRSTPTGAMAIDRKAEHPTWHVPESIRKDHQAKGDPLPAVVSPGPDNPLGDYAFYLNKPNYLIHGTNKPYSIGFRASNGCLRLYPEDIEKLYGDVAVKTPIRIVNQPYLIGWLDGEPYLEAHEPFEEADAKRLVKELNAKLKQIEKKQGIKLDWPKIDATLTQARGLPTPIRIGSQNLEQTLAGALALQRPARLVGQPQPVADKTPAWYVKIEETENARDAERLAAMLNHQGPRIPAKAVVDGPRQHVLAGPYDDAKSANEAIKRLRVDLEMKGKIVAPDTTLKLGDTR
ncbi:L,D-transpeptidase family protein [Methylococcus sp. EFPC2]|uniref:L,D-transpeptidase family protein n=1 Tax=Methylococcus sp. EFPC2 TaxID=2812648 RepID=UPI0019674E45|nr:L,D-transpeptidase family protein [Methylococcus sp. EFPC2]QSA95815.1 L,D-transpeptidase family protein [Methylococcus sp. EFPC2]